jgi:uncharacterized iron-regulated membrane protein
MANEAAGGFHGAFRQSMSWLHTWVGLVLSVILYFMFITGSTGYVHAQITRWMEPERGVMTAEARAAPLAHTSEAMAEAAFTEARARAPEATAIYIGWPVKGSPYQNYYLYAEGADIETLDLQIDPDRLVVAEPGAGAARETGGGDALYQMHYDLHYIPFHQFIVFGYTLPALPTLIVGVATMFMLVATVTGIVVHKKIFADFFTFRPSKGQRSWLDAHNLASVLTLPFIIMITYSGLIFYAYEYMPTVRDTTYGTSDAAREAFEHENYPKYYAHKREPAGLAAEMAPIGPMLAAAREEWSGLEPQWIDIHNPGDANATALIWSTTEKEVSHDLYRTIWFDATTGERLSAADSGVNTAGVIGDFLITLHEGNFAGPALRLLYFATGLTGAAMIATGLVLWSVKRRQRLRMADRADFGLEFVERTNVGIIVGLPIGVAAYFWANRLLPVGMEGRADWEMHVLFLTWGAALLASALVPARRAWPVALGIAASAFGLIPALNAVTTEVHLGSTLAGGDWELASVDLVCLVIAGFFAVACRKALGRAQSDAAGRRQRHLEPAE